MSKELEALSYLYNDLRLMKCLDIVEEAKIKSAYECLQQALQRLEAIDNANPSEALECLKRYHNSDVLKEDKYGLVLDDKTEYNTIKQALIKLQKQEKALDIIKKKDVDISYLKNECHFELCLYNKYLIETKQLTQEEFELIREILK